MKLLRWIIALGIVGALLVGGLIAFVVTRPYFDPELPALESVPVEWDRYDDEKLGFSLEVPVDYVAELSPGDPGVRFSYQGSSLVHVAWLDREEADDRGLWADHDPVANVLLDDRAGEKYEYNHFDAVFGVHTHSWVFPHRGKFLALEVRTRKASILEEFGIGSEDEVELDEVARRIVDSLRIDD